MKKIKIVFFGSKSYDRSSFERENENYGYDIKFFTGNLSLDNVSLTRGADAVCIFVNDNASREVIEELAQNGVRLIALRCAGFNNVDLAAAAEYGITVVRVPAYSPYAVAEYSLALMLSLNRDRNDMVWKSPMGFLGEAMLRMGRFELRDRIYAGNPQFSDYEIYGAELHRGDPYYRSSLYNRTDIRYYLLNRLNVQCYIGASFHYTEGALDNSQQVVLRVFL